MENNGYFLEGTMSNQGTPGTLKPNCLVLKFILILFFSFLLAEALFLTSLFLYFGEISIHLSILFLSLASCVLAFIFTAFTMIIFHRTLLGPLLQFRNHILMAEQNSQELKPFPIPDRGNELQDIFIIFNTQLKRIQAAAKTIKAHEAIMALGVEERTQILDQITNYDFLTGLPNQNLLKVELAKFILEAEENKKHAYLLMLELRDFHEIIDAFGHNVADLFLKEVGSLLTQNTSAGTVVAHLSYTRFAISKNALNNPHQIIPIAQLILDLFTSPLKIAEQNILTTVNLGVAIYPHDGQNADLLLTNANLALNRAKTQGLNNYQFYESSMNQAIEVKHTLLVDLHYAIDQNQFRVYYQPKIGLKTGKLVGLEALVRWEHPEKGLISPSDFIPIAEESGLITIIGEWILRTACQQTKLWHDEGFKELNVAVNLSTIQFKQENIVDIVHRALMDSALPPRYLELEITESGVMNNIQRAIVTMNAFHDLGIILSLDDFGTGYSSLSYLKRFPVQKLKVDQSFVKDLGPMTDKSLVDIIILLGHSLDLKVVAEGVETKEQLFYLKERGCDEIQGYYFSKPIPADLCPALFKKLI